MQPEITTRIKVIAESTPLVLDMLPAHVLLHFAHALQVLGVRHPEEPVRARTWTAYCDLCEYMHVNMETPQQMMARLRDEI